MCEIPPEIKDAEKIVRIILEDHLNDSGTAIKPRAFRSKTDEVSVIRADYRDANFCKEKAKEREATAPSKYAGFAVLFVGSVRKVGSEVHDSREVYCGHAHISHNIPAPAPNEPPPASQLKELDERTKLLRDMAQFHKDPDPSASSWNGAAALVLMT
jgi:hypothetical protein